MPITAAQVDSLKMCSTCDEDRVIEPADVTVLYGSQDEVFPLCWYHADHSRWYNADTTDVVTSARSTAPAS